MKASSRLILNTFAQYFRTAANVVLVLFATRLVLHALGEIDYGIYTLIAGVVSMLSFFTNSLSSTTQRYLSYNIGKSDTALMRSYFASSIGLHLIIGVFIVVTFFAIEPLLFNGFLNIDPLSIEAAKSVYYILIAMLFIALMTSPFRAVLLTHENIVYISAVDVLDGILKLLIAYIIAVFPSGRLVWYAAFMSLISVVNLLAFGLYSLTKYSECKLLSLKCVSINRIKELSSFAGWTIYGTLCLFGRVQGLAIVLNKFFGAVVNAAYGIALQVNAALMQISGALQTAISPQLIKAEGDKDRTKVLRLSESACKYSFILLSIVSFPIIFNMQGILVLWLGSVPEYSAYFCIILIVSNLFDQLTTGFNITMNALGKIRNFTVTINTIKLFTVLIVAWLLISGVDLKLAFLSYVLIEIIGCILRINFVRHYAGLDVRHYISSVLGRLTIPVIIVLTAYYLWEIPIFSISKFLVQGISLTFVYLIFIYVFSLTKDEKIFFTILITNAFHKK